MEFKDYLINEIKNHPSAQPQDIVKLCFQAAFGAEHILSDTDRARAYLEAEFARTEPSDAPIYEQISDSVCRVNLGAWKKLALPIEWLFSMFSASSKIKNGSEELFEEYLNICSQVVSEREIFPIEEWHSFIEEYKAHGICAVHHSESYRNNEKPAYRIVCSEYVRLLPILTAVKKQAPKVIAIDGRAASGKSTMASQLADILGASVIYMDDFFLPPALRSPQRFEEAGGNVHYERFIEEVLPHLGNGGFSYRQFDCGIMDYNGERVISPAPCYIVEGSYSTHPKLGDYAELTVFSSVEPEEQMRRILKRNGERLAAMFREKWIPMEEKYFEHFSVLENAHLQV